MNSSMDNIVTATTVMVVQASLSISFILAVLILQIWAIIENKGLSLKTSSSRGRIWLLGLSIFVIASWVVQLGMFGFTWTDPQSCNTIVSPFSPLFFVASKQFLYYFLMERSEVVHASLKLNNRYFLLFRGVVRLVIVFGIQAGFGWSFFVIFKGVIFPNQACVMYSNLGPVIAFAVCDALLSLCLLFLFAFPLYIHITSDIGNVDMKTDMYHLMKRNLILSCLISASTVSSLLIMAVFYSIANGKTDPNLEYLQIYGHFFPSVDLVLSTSLTLKISNMWMPKKLVRLVKMRTRDDLTRSSPKKHQSIRNIKAIHSIEQDQSQLSRAHSKLTVSELVT